MKEIKFTGRILKGTTEVRELELTKEQKEANITLDRIKEYLYEEGEDFLEQHSKIADYKVTCGFLLAKYPKYNKKILDSLNGDRFWSDLIDDIGEDDFYSAFCKLANLTVYLKERINTILYSIKYYYKGKI